MMKMDAEELFEYLEGLLCYVGDEIDAGNRELEEIWQWLEDIMIQYEKTFNIGKGGATK